MIVRMYKNEKFWNFCAGFETRDRLSIGIRYIRDEKSCFEMFYIVDNDYVIAGQKENAKIFFKHAEFNNWKHLHGLYIEINQPGRFIFTNKLI